MFANSKKVTTFAPAIEREILDKKDGPFVYRLGRKIFILERGVRFPHGLPNKEAIEYSIASLFLSYDKDNNLVSIFISLSIINIPIKINSNNVKPGP